MAHDNPAVLTPDEATAALREASRVRLLGRRLVHGQATRLPLVWWGVAWMVTYTAAQFLPIAPAAAVGAVTGVAAYALSRVGRRWDPAPGRTGWERQLLRGWWAVLAGGAVLDVMVAPAPGPVLFLVPGALWGLALLLYAVAVEDLRIGVLGAGVILLAGVLRLFFLDHALLLFGLLGGGWMAVTGVVRVLGTGGGR